MYMCVALRAVAPESVLFRRAGKERAETHTHTRQGNAAATRRTRRREKKGRKGKRGGGPKAVEVAHTYVYDMNMHT